MVVVDDCKEGQIMDYYLCPDGWRLYGEWSAALERKDKPAAAKLRRLFLQHRAGCKSTPPCTPPTRAAEYDSDREEPEV